MTAFEANPYGAIAYVIGDGSGALSTGSQGHVVIPFNCTITQWTLLADVSGSVAIDVKTGTYGAFPTTTTIFSPSITAAQKNQALVSSAITSGQVMEFTVTSASSIKRVVITLRLLKDRDA